MKCKCGNDNNRAGTYKTCSKCAEYIRAYYRANREELNAKKRAYYAENSVVREELYRKRRKQYQTRKLEAFREIMRKGAKAV